MKDKFGDYGIIGLISVIILKKFIIKHFYLAAEYSKEELKMIF